MSQAQTPSNNPDLSCEAPPVPTPVMNVLRKPSGGGGFKRSKSLFKKSHHHKVNHHLDPDYVPMRLPEGKVVGVWGAAVLRDAQGKVHTVRCGDDVEKGDVILTAQNGIVEIHGGPGLAHAFPVVADAGELEFDAPGAGLEGGGSADGGLLGGLRVDRVIEIVTPQEYAYSTQTLTSSAIEYATGAETGTGLVTGTNSGGDTGGGDGGNTGGGDTPRQPTIGITGPSELSEDAGSGTYTLTLSEPATEDVTVQITYTGTASDGSDYLAVEEVVIPAGQTSVTFELPIQDDALAEGAETVVLTLKDPTGGGFESIAIDPDAGSVTTLIQDDVTPDGSTLPGAEDTVLVSLTGPGEVVEGQTASGYTVSLSQPAEEDLTIELTYSGTAEDGSDFTGVTTVTIPAGASSATFDIATLADDVADDGESFQITLSGYSGGGFEAVAAHPEAYEVTTVIVEDTIVTPPGDDVLTVGLSGPDSVVEGEVATGYTITLSQPALQDVTIELSYSGTAEDGSDFTGVTTVTIPAGSSSATFDIATLDDALAEGSEAFSVSIAEVTGGGYLSTEVDPLAASVTTTIVDDVDPSNPGGGTPGTEDTVLCSLSGPDQVTEGEVASGYTLTLGQPAVTDVTVSLAYSGVAQDGSDFTGVATVTIPAGSSSATFDIATIDDALAEGSEAFTVSIGEITGGGFEAIAADPSAGSVTTTIVDEVDPSNPGGGTPGAEDTVLCSLSGPDQVTEGEVASGYTVTLGQPALTDVTVSLTYSGVAQDGSDFTGVTTVTIPAGSSSATFDIATIDDPLAEGSESFTVSIGDITGGGFEAISADPSAGSVTTTIVDDVDPSNPGGGTPGTEDTVLCSLSGPDQVTEGEVASGYTVTLGQPALTDVTVSLTYSGVAQDGSDFTGVTTVTIPAGSSSATFDIATIDDPLAEGSEAFTVSIGEITGGGFEAVAADPSAGSVTTTIVDDVDPSNPGGGTPGTEDTVLCSLSGPDQVTEGEVASGYTVTLGQPALTDVTVSLTYSGVAQDGSDFTGVTTVTIPAGSSSATFDIATIDDPLAEGSEAFTVSIGEITGGGFEAVAADPSAGSVTTTIVDDVDPSNPGGGTPGGEDTVLCSLSGPDQVTEGEVASGYIVTLGQPALTDVTVTLTYSGVAQDGTDFTGVATVTIPAGATSDTFDIATLDDALAEGSEAFTVSIGEITGGGFEAVAINPAAASVTTTIVDDVDPSNPGGGTPGVEDTVLCSLSGPDQVTEGEVASGYIVTLGQPAVTDVTVTLTYSGVAQDGTDFTGVATVTIPAGATSDTFDIATLDDALAEGSEAFTVSIGEITGGGFEAVAINPAAASVTTTIVDDVDPSNPGGGTPGVEDTVLCSLSGPDQVTEGEVASGYIVTLGQPALTDVTVTLTYSGVAQDGTDFTGVITVTIPAGSSSATFEIATIDDALAEGSEAFTVSIGEITGGGFEAVAADPAAGSVTTTIVDDVDPSNPGGGTPGTEDTVLCSLSGPDQVTEGEVASGYTLTLGQPAVTDVTITLTYSGVAQDGSDFTGVTTATIPAGATSATFDIATIDDALAEGSEAFTVSIGEITGGGFEAIAADPSAGSVTTTIVDDVDPSNPGGGTPGTEDTVLCSLSGPDQVTEGEVASGYTLTLDQPALTDVTVTLTYSGVAQDGSDFTGVATVTIPAGSSSATFDIATIDDALAEGSESFTVSIGEITGGGFEAVAADPAAGSVTTTIADNGDSGGGDPGDDTLLCSLTGPDSVTEGEVASGYTLALDHPALTDVTVSLTYSGVAQDGSDFTGVTTVTIPAGSSSATFDIATIDDPLAEGCEAFTVTLADITGGGYATSEIDPLAASVTTTIVDDVDPSHPGGGTPGSEDTVLIGVCGPDETMEGVTASGYHVGLSQPAVTDLTVTLTFSGTASDGVDFTHVTSVTIPAGQNCVEFSLDILDDAWAEGNESIQIGLDLGSVVGGGFEALSLHPDHPSATTVILDNDAPGGGDPGDDTLLCSLTGPESVTEGEVAPGYTLTLDHPALTDVTVSLTYSGVAQDGSDFTGVATVTIPAGSSSAIFDIATIDDPLAEGCEAFTIGIAEVTGGGFETVAVNPEAAEVTTTIVDDVDPAQPDSTTPGMEDSVIVGLTGPGEVFEGNSADGYTLTLSREAASDLTVQLIYTGTASDGSDFTAVTSVTLAAGTRSVTFDIQTLVDNATEGTEAYTVSIAGTTGGGFEHVAVDSAASAVTTLLIDSSAPEVGHAIARVSEEDLNQGLADDSGLHTGDDASATRVTEGHLTLSDQEGDVLQVSLTAPTAALTSGGHTIVWTGEGSHTLVGHVGSAEGPTALTVQIDDAGQYRVELAAPLDHPVQGEDVLTLDVGVQVSDGTHVSAGTLSVVVEDDSPVATHTTVHVSTAPVSITVHDLDAGFVNDSYRNGTAQVTRADTDSHDTLADRLRWGTSASQCGTGNSGYDLTDNTAFTSPGGSTVQAGEVFKIAEFNHVNQAISSSSSVLASTDLKISLVVDINGVSAPVELTAHLVHTETPNSCDADASRDIIQLPAQTVTVVVAGQSYELNLLGFKDASGQLVTEIRTAENSSSNTYGIYGSVTPVELPPELVGQVQTESGADLPGTLSWGDTHCPDGVFVGEADGSYTFAVNPTTRAALEASGESVTHTFTYEVRDADGDVSTGSVTLVLGNGVDTAPVVLASSLQAIAPDTMGLAGEYYGYNDNRSGRSSDPTFSGNTRQHADDGSARYDDSGNCASSQSANLNSLGDLEHIIEGRAGDRTLVDSARSAPSTAADATFKAHEIDFGLQAGTATALFSNDLGQSSQAYAAGSTVTGHNLDRFLHGTEADNAGVITATTGVGDTTDAILRMVGQANFEGGCYDLRVTADDGYRITIGGETIAQTDLNQYVATHVHSGVTLADGLQSIEIDYWDQGGHASLRIELKPSGAPDSDYQTLGTDAFALFTPDQAPELSDLQDIVADASSESGWSVRTGVAYEGTDARDQVSGSDGRDQISGGRGHDTLDGGANDDTLQGGAGSDVLTGGLGHDVFRWSLADAGTQGQTAEDQITDFVLKGSGQEGDVLDLRDLLQGENACNLSNFLHVEQSGSDTLISVSSKGGYADGFDAGATDQTIRLADVSLPGGDSMSMIQDLIQKGQLQVDHG